MLDKFSELAVKLACHQHTDKVRVLLRRLAFELIFRGETHDLSKLSEAELEVFAEYSPKLKEVSYGSDLYQQHLKAMQPALDHHYANNAHHPEHYGSEGVRGMNLVDLVEMFCDWFASSQRHADGDLDRSIDINQKRFGLSDDLVAILKNTLKILRVEEEEPQKPLVKS